MTDPEPPLAWPFRPNRILGQHNNVINMVAFAPDGVHLAGSSADHTVRIWNAETGEVEQALEGHAEAVAAVAYRPDGQMLTTGSADGTARLWDAASGACLHVLRSPSRYEGMNITSVTGISEAQRVSLKTLGAVKK